MEKLNTAINCHDWLLTKSILETETLSKQELEDSLKVAAQAETYADMSNLYAAIEVYELVNEAYQSA